MNVVKIDFKFYVFNKGITLKRMPIVFQLEYTFREPTEKALDFITRNIITI